MNLLTDPWLPVRRASGARLRLSPSQLTLSIDDPVVALDWPRADFNAAAAELLIGMLSVASVDRLADPEAWEAWWVGPPTSSVLAAQLAPLAAAFSLTGDGPRFAQDLDPLEGEPKPVAGLLIDAPGAQTLNQNGDLFVHRGGCEVLALTTAAMALFTLQTYSPAGGAGIMTGLRGGGPMTTLVLPPPPHDTLWHTLWLNTVWPRRWPDPLTDLSRVFPWLTPTRVSGKQGTRTRPVDVHPAQAFFGLPRRMRLMVEDNAQGVACALTGAVEPWIVRHYVSRRYGTDYIDWHRAHPLSPYYRPKKDSQELFPRHPQDERLCFRHYAGLIHDHEKGLALPAEVLGVARERLRDLRLDGPTRLRVLGYDMDNMKARGFTDIALPFIVAPDEDLAQEIDRFDRLLVDSAVTIAGALQSAISDAQPGATVTGKGLLALAREQFWDELDERFRTVQAEIAANVADIAALETRQALLQRWRNTLEQVATTVFRRHAPWDRLADLNTKDQQALILAWSALQARLRGPKLREQLGLPTPAKTPKAPKTEPDPQE